jgi:hypothetical protein
MLTRNFVQESVMNIKELYSFQRMVLPEVLQQIRFLHVEAQALTTYKLDLLKCIRKRGDLKEVTISYFDKEESAQAIVMDITQEVMLKKICQSFLILEADCPTWRRRYRKTEYVQIGSTALVARGEELRETEFKRR